MTPNAVNPEDFAYWLQGAVVVGIEFCVTDDDCYVCLETDIGAKLFFRAPELEIGLDLAEVRHDA